MWHARRRRQAAGVRQSHLGRLHGAGRSCTKFLSPESHSTVTSTLRHIRPDDINIRVLGVTGFRQGGGAAHQIIGSLGRYRRRYSDSTAAQSSPYHGRTREITRKRGRKRREARWEPMPVVPETRNCILAICGRPGRSSEGQQPSEEVMGNRRTRILAKRSLAEVLEAVLERLKLG